MFEVCKSEQWRRPPLGIQPASSPRFLPLLPAVLEIKQYNTAKRIFFPLSFLLFLSHSRAPNFLSNLNHYQKMSRFTDTKPFQREAWAPEREAQKSTEETFPDPRSSQSHIQGSYRLLCQVSSFFSDISSGSHFWILVGPPTLGEISGCATGGSVSSVNHLLNCANLSYERSSSMKPFLNSPAQTDRPFL